jgi:hypothetical protein
MRTFLPNHPLGTCINQWTGAQLRQMTSTGPSDSVFSYQKQAAAMNSFTFQQNLLKLINKDLMIFFRKMITGYHVFYGIPESMAAR